MDIGNAIAEEETQLKAVLADTRRQKEDVLKRAAEAKHSSSQDAGSRQPTAKSDQSSNTAQQPGSLEEQQQQPDSDAPQVDGHADVSAPCQPVKAAATQISDAPEQAAGASAAGPHVPAPADTAGHGDGVADVASVPDQLAAAPVLFTTDVSEEVSGVSAPIHFTDGSEATVVSARGITVQEQVVTTNAAEGPDPVKAAAIKETLASLHLAESEAAQAFSEGKPDASSMPKEDETIGAPATLVLAAVDADTDANLLRRIASQGHLAARSNDLMSRVDEQVLAGAQLDPEQLSGRKLSDTITQLLGSYDELNPSPAQGATEAAAELCADTEAAPEASASYDKPAARYASLAQIRERLADQASKDSEESSDTAVVRAWLQANMPGLDIASAAPVDITQIAVLEGTLECSEVHEQQASTLTRQTVEATLAEAMAHAEQCLRLITSAEETPDLKALDALEAAKRLHADLAAMSGADITLEDVTGAAGQTAGQATGLGRPPLGKRILAGVSRASATLIAGSVLIAAWNVFLDHQRSAHWPPPT